MKASNEFECCPSFAPEQWDDKMLLWENKKFIKGRVCTFFYVPLNFGAAMRRLDKKLTASGAGMVDYLYLAHHTSKWNMDVYLAVDREVPGAENLTLSGKFYSKVYEGHREMGQGL